MNANFPFVSNPSTKQRVLDAIRWHFRAYGSSPSHEQIAELARIAPKRVHGYVVKLKAEGYLTFQARVHRSIMLVDRGAMLSDAELRIACAGRGQEFMESIGAALVEVFKVQSDGADPDADLLGKLE